MLEESFIVFKTMWDLPVEAFRYEMKGKASEIKEIVEDYISKVIIFIL